MVLLHKQGVTQNTETKKQEHYYRTSTHPQACPFVASEGASVATRDDVPYHGLICGHTEIAAPEGASVAALPAATSQRSVTNR